jgi:FkbM family methyltransferase
MMTASYFSALFGTKIPGEGCVYTSQSLKFKRPVYIDDIVTATIVVTSIDTNKRRVKFKTVCKVKNRVVTDGEAELYVPLEFKKILTTSKKELLKYKTQIFELYKNSFNKKPLIVDCGSNIGSSCLYFSKQFKNSSIIALEPDKDNFEFCKNNIKGNNFYLFNNAISNMEQTVGFTPNYVDSRASKISNDNKNKIKCLTVNNILAEFNSVNYFPYLIKIDIEGYEKNLFIDNYEWLDKFKIVIIELHDWMLPTEGNSFNFLRALTDIMVKKTKRDLILSGENLISIRIDE